MGLHLEAVALLYLGCQSLFVLLLLASLLSNSRLAGLCTAFVMLRLGTQMQMCQEATCTTACQPCSTPIQHNLNASPMGRALLLLHINKMLQALHVRLLTG